MIKVCCLGRRAKSQNLDPSRFSLKQRTFFQTLSLLLIFLNFSSSCQPDNHKMPNLPVRKFTSLNPMTEFLVNIFQAYSLWLFDSIFQTCMFRGRDKSTSRKGRTVQHGEALFYGLSCGIPQQYVWRFVTMFEKHQNKQNHIITQCLASFLHIVEANKYLIHKLLSGKILNQNNMYPSKSNVKCYISQNKYSFVCYSS